MPHSGMQFSDEDLGCHVSYTTCLDVVVGPTEIARDRVAIDEQLELYEIRETLTGCGHDVLQPFDATQKQKKNGLSSSGDNAPCHLRPLRLPMHN
ncbi:hypothetical protein OUZ56_021734 [Daphnia magna]|uniref:Uncharacterized protein n=1 Tax=Daphnia magna TaxID=35525 RepID=A0ABR0AUI2_9CRUS|nr:hypothetical protein OUZ56_021734 [Daphnia magna]